MPRPPHYAVTLGDAVRQFVSVAVRRRSVQFLGLLPCLYCGIGRAASAALCGDVGRRRARPFASVGGIGHGAPAAQCGGVSHAVLDSAIVQFAMHRLFAARSVAVAAWHLQFLGLLPCPFPLSGGLRMPASYMMGCMRQFLCGSLFAARLAALHRPRTCVLLQFLGLLPCRSGCIVRAASAALCGDVEQRRAHRSCLRHRPCASAPMAISMAPSRAAGAAEDLVSPKAARSVIGTPVAAVCTQWKLVPLDHVARHVTHHPICLPWARAWMFPTHVYECAPRMDAHCSRHLRTWSWREIEATLEPIRH